MATKTPKMTRLTDLRPKGFVRFGEYHESSFGKSSTHNADIIKNESIRIYGIEGNRMEPEIYDRTFKLGDEVEYHSYNLIYTGEIVAIGEKTVTIHKGGYPAGENVRLELFWFADKNWNFDSKRIADHNYAESFCI